MMESLSVAAQSMHGRLLGEDAMFEGVSTDTRTLARGELFVALRGPNFDGEDYVAQAAEKGAAGAVVGHHGDASLPQIEVDDTRRALGSLGSAWRRKQSAVVVGITGSNGKTTVKELAAACLAQAGPVLATEGNLNNDIGMPLMLTRIEPEHRFAVLEMGANHVGEIAYLTALAEPDVVAITNAGDAHLEGFGSLEGIARGKGEILGGRVRPGVAVLNADDAWFEYWASLAKDAEILTFGVDAEADVRATDIEVDAAGASFRLQMPPGAMDVRLGLPGRHNVRNACTAAAIALALGVLPEQIQAALEMVRPVSGRLEPCRGRGGASVYDDTYNANPLSVASAAEFLASLDGASVFVLGDMGELGDAGARLHRDVGEAVRAAGVDRLYATGELSRNAVETFGDRARWFESVDALIEALGEELAANVNVLVKGSRFMRMERVVDAISITDEQAPAELREGA